MSATAINDKIEKEQQLSVALQGLKVSMEAYPNLKANENFQDLQRQLSETEDKIAYSRQFYNDTVMMYNNKCQMFPSNIIANQFNFEIEEFFEIAETEKEVPEIKFRQRFFDRTFN